MGLRSWVPLEGSLPALPGAEPREETGAEQEDGGEGGGGQREHGGEPRTGPIQRARHHAMLGERRRADQAALVLERDGLAALLRSAAPTAVAAATAGGRREAAQTDRPHGRHADLPDLYGKGSRTERGGRARGPGRGGRKAAEGDGEEPAAGTETDYGVNASWHEPLPAMVDVVL